MKALILSYLEPQGWGLGITMGVPRPPSVKLFLIFFSEVVEAKRVDFWLSQNSASHECTDTIFITLKCIFDGLISILFWADRVERPCISNKPSMFWLGLVSKPKLLGLRQSWGCSIFVHLEYSPMPTSKVENSHSPPQFHWTMLKQV